MSDSSVPTARKGIQSESDKNFVRQAESKATHLVEEGADKAEAALGEGERLAKAAGAQVQETRELLSEKIKESPLTAVAIAFAAGILFSAARR
ncbi:MAG: hypothetical protein ACK46Q_10415 [Hyphomonas sp.]